MSQTLPRHFILAFGKDGITTIKPDRPSAGSAMRDQTQLIASQRDGNQVVLAGRAKCRYFRVLHIGDKRPAGRDKICQAMQTFRTVTAISGMRAGCAASGKHGDVALIEGESFIADRVEREFADRQFGARMGEKRPATVRVCGRCARQAPAADRNPVAARQANDMGTIVGQVHDSATDITGPMIVNDCDQWYSSVVTWSEQRADDRLSDGPLGLALRTAVQIDRRPRIDLQDPAPLLFQWSSNVPGHDIDAGHVESYSTNGIDGARRHVGVHTVGHINNGFRAAVGRVALQNDRSSGGGD